MSDQTGPQRPDNSYPVDPSQGLIEQAAQYRKTPVPVPTPLPATPVVAPAAPAGKKPAIATKHPLIPSQLTKPRPRWTSKKSLVFATLMWGWGMSGGVMLLRSPLLMPWLFAMVAGVVLSYRAARDTDLHIAARIWGWFVCFGSVGGVLQTLLFVFTHVATWRPL